MNKRRKIKKRNLSSTKSPSGEKKNLSPTQSPPGEKLIQQIQTLIAQKQYSQALNKLQRIRQTQSEIEINPSEATLWSLRGQQELARGNERQAEKSLRKSLELGLHGEAHYWLAKCLLASERLEEAVELLREAFDTQVLPKDYAGCYLKLLFLIGKRQTVQELITSQPKRFSASQLHWARGMLALQASEPGKALIHWQKMKQSATPGDCQVAWLAYGQQQNEHWEAAESILGLNSSSFLSDTLPSHPAIQRLSVVQAFETGGSLQKTISLSDWESPNQEALLVLEMLLLIEEQNFHEAAHLALKLARPSRQFPELDRLFHPLMLLAGDQAWNQGDTECTKEFWSPLVTENTFDPQMAVRLNEVLVATGSSRERQRLLTKLLNWLKKEAKQNRSDWPESRLNPTLAKLYCWLADSCMAGDQPQKGFGFLLEAERLCPDLPDVIGRRGLRAYAHDQIQEAIPLLKLALEKGCRYEEVYLILLECFEELGDSKGQAEIHRRFGKHFDDFSVDVEFDIPVWVEALSQSSYLLFERIVLEGSPPEPALKACRIFVQAAEDQPNNRQRISLDQEQAAQQWQQILESLAPSEQIPVLQAIGLCLLRFAKRKKGLAGLINQYLQELFSLVPQEPEAQRAHLILLAVKELKPERLKIPLRQYLDRATQPGTTLAQLQLQVRRFTQTAALLPFLEEAIRREPQNPLLLLAKATTFPAESLEYEELKEQGFELARRLQDSQSLKAWREEDAFQSKLRVGEDLLDLPIFGGTGQLDMESILEKLARKILGEEFPPEVLEEMLPELRRLLNSDPSELEEEEDEYPDEFGFPFGKSSRSQKSSKRKRGFKS